MPAFGQKLYLFRVRKGITQAELSVRSKVSQANLSKIEKGAQDPTVSTFLKICSALEVSPAKIFEEDFPGTPPPLTRASAERIAKGVLKPSLKLSPEERDIAELLRDLVPGFRKRPLSAKKIHGRWYELKRRLPAEAIRMLGERIQDERSRTRAREEHDYEQLLIQIRKTLGKGRTR